MSHLVLIDDAQGDLVDVRTYCSDFCAQSDDAYAGWNGCNELEFDTPCDECGNLIKGFEGALPE
jgi:hypothetical protein